MKRTVMLIYAFIFLCFATSFAQNTYVINGSLPDNSWDGNKVTLAEESFRHASGRLILDSTTVENGQFSFRGEFNQKPSLARIVITSTPTLGTLFILEPGEIFLQFEGQDEITVAGTTLNEEYYREVTVPTKLMLKNSRQILDTRKQAIKDSTWTQENERDYRKSIDRAEIKKKRLQENAFMEKYLSSYPGIVSEYIVSYIYDTVRQNAYLDQMPEDYARNMKTRIEYRKERAKEIIRNYKPLPESTPSNVAVGMQFTEIQGKSPDGEEKKLSELVKGNKITILDFWASWCGPCLKEMPFMVSLKEEFGSKGVEIIGISIDQSEINWKKTLENNNMPWPHILCETAGDIYSIHSIPYTLIIDQKGIIVGKALRGDNLKDKIREILAE